MSTKGARTQVPSDSPKVKNSRPSQGKQADDGGESSYIDSLFFGELPVVKCRPPGESTEPVSPDLGVQDAGFIDQAYFQEQPEEDSSGVSSEQSVADCILGVREQLSINQYTGHTIDFDRQGPVFLNRRDSQGFRIPDDDAVKFYKLTEDEATEVLWRCIIINLENIIVLNKPPGISSHGGPGQSFSVDSLLPRLAHKLRLGPHDETDILQITHRLDKETTGALLISRNKDTHLKLTEAFANRWIRKSYLCITSGIPRSKDGSITLPIREKQIGGKYRMVAKRPPKTLEDEEESTGATEAASKSAPVGTNAVTHYQLLDRRNDAALLQCTTFTGIRHQIRVHLSTALETPVLGDHKYSHFGFLAPQRLSNRTLEALQIRQSKVRYLGLHLHSHKLHFGVQGDEEAGERPGSNPLRPTPPGFFSFIERDPVRHSRDAVAPVPVFFLSNMKRLGLRFPKLIKWTRCRIF